MSVYIFNHDTYEPIRIYNSSILYFIHTIPMNNSKVNNSYNNIWMQILISGKTMTFLLDCTYCVYV